MDKLNLKPCPCCGAEAKIVSSELYSDHNNITIQCTNCYLTLEHTQWYLMNQVWNGHQYVWNKAGVSNESAIDLWNRRTSDLGNEASLILDQMFPKCKDCKSRPSDYSKTLCICNGSMYIPKYPQRGQDARFQFGNYEKIENEVN